MYMLNHW